MAANLAGLCMGSSLSAGRALVAYFSPADRSGEFFGLFALSGRATAWMAPTAIAIVTTMTQTQRWGVAIVLPFLVIGFCLLWFVREERAAPVH